MNLVLLVNTLNLPDIARFVESAAASQQTKALGALAVVYQQKIGADAINELVGPLLAKFSAGAAVPVQINSQLPNDARNATLFALFVMQVYARFPGPWLVVDGPALVREPDFMQAIEKQHKGLGGPVSGRASTEGSGLTPIGPVVLGLPVKQLKWFSPGITESWRARARFLLGRCGFKVVPLSEYLFSIPGIEATVSPDTGSFRGVLKPNPAYTTPPESAATTTENPSQLTVVPRFSVGDLAQSHPEAPHDMEVDKIVEIGLGSDGGSVRLERGGVFHQDDLVLVSADIPQTLEVASTQDSETRAANRYDHLDREGLFALIEERGLDKPHHSTGAPKLIALLEAAGDSTITP